MPKKFESFDPNQVPANELSGFGEEINLALEGQQKIFELTRDTAIAMQTLSNNPKALARTLAVLEAKYGEKIQEIKAAELKQMVSRMTPEEKDQFEKEIKRKMGYTIKPEDLPTKEELEEMGVVMN